jgi:HAE1 family hydrophobic/amphiphilic exporter-1
MQLTRLAIARPVAILMIVGAFIVLGIISYAMLPAELNPQVDFPEIDVYTTYTGTSPQEMETLVTKPIEDSISGVSGVQQINSSSQQGVSLVRIQFYFGTNLDSADAEVIQKVDAIRSALPTDAGSPSVLKQDSSSEPVMYLAMESNKESLIDLNRLATNVVQPQLEQATDVSSISVYGGETREILVQVPQDRLAAYGATIHDLSTAVQNANVNEASGFIQKDSQFYDVRLVGEFASVNEIRNLRLVLNNQTVTLGDIATVTDSYQEKTTDSFLNGRSALTLVVNKTSDGNTLAAVSSVLDQVKALKSIVPPDVHFIVVKDFSTYVRGNLNDVVTTLFLGSLMAILVVYIFLHNIRGTIIVALALPTSMIATFIPLEAMGYSLNSMTLMGLSLAVGILVDDSIVVLENINRHLALGEEPVVAAINGRGEIGLAALILTSVDLVVFLPIAFMGGVIGEFFRSFGLTVAFATLCSLFISFTLTPMLASRWYKKGEILQSRDPFARAFDRGFNAFELAYQNLLRRALHHPWITVGIGNAFLIVIFVTVVPHLGFRFAPDQDQNAVQISVEAPAGASLAYTTGICRQVEARIRANARLDYDTQFISTNVGESSIGGAGSGSSGTQYATINLQLYDRKSVIDTLTFWKRSHLRTNSDVSDAAVVRGLVQSIVGAKIEASNAGGFNGGGAPLEVDLTGPDFTKLLAATAKVEAMMKATPGTYDVDESFKNSQPEAEVRLDRTKAAEYGLSLQTVADVLSDSVAGNIDTKYRDPNDGEQYNIRVQLASFYRDNPGSVANIIVGYQKGNPVYLGDVAAITVGAAPVKIDRLNRQREIAVTAYLLPGFQVGNVGEQLNKTLAKTAFNEVTYTFGGEAQIMGRESGYLGIAVALGIILSYMLMAALFNNLVYPFSIMLSLPQAWAGAFIALLISGQPLSLISMIGIILLNGIVNKNAILLVDYTNTLRARGYKRVDALLEAGPTRMRPIMMTTLAIVVSSIPTALALGRGAGFRQSLGIAVIGGVTLSLMVTPLVIPCAYLIFDNFTNFVGRVLLRRPTPRMIDFDTDVPIFSHSHDEEETSGETTDPIGSGADR